MMKKLSAKFFEKQSIYISERRENEKRLQKQKRKIESNYISIYIHIVHDDKMLGWAAR